MPSVLDSIWGVGAGREGGGDRASGGLFDSLTGARFITICTCVVEICFTNIYLKQLFI